MRVLEQVTVEEVAADLASVNVLDVRGEAEYRSGHIPGARHIHAGFLADRLTELPTDRPLVVHCVSGDRSSIAASYLLSRGFSNVRNLTCGFNGWNQKGFEIQRILLNEAAVMSNTTG
jgi:hydroxyacylglutathione hydrolase